MLSSRPLPPLWRFAFEFPSFGVLCVWRRQPFEFVLCCTLCDDSYASSLVPNPLKSWVLTNWNFCVLEKTSIHFDLTPNSQDPFIFWERSLGDMFTGQVWRYPPSFVGFRLRLLEICHLELWLRAVWERPVWPVWATGLEFQFPAQPVWPVWTSGQTGLTQQSCCLGEFSRIASVSLPRVFCLEIASP